MSRASPQRSAGRSPVNDCAVDAWKLIWGNVRSAEAHGATILPYHWVTGVLRQRVAVVGAV